MIMKKKVLKKGSKDGRPKTTKKRKRPPRKNEGRPLIKFDEKKWKDFEQLCSLQCTKIEITEWLEVNDETLDRLLKVKYKMSFSEVYKLKRSKGLTSLRRAQFKMSLISPAMAIFLGKNLLSQKDKSEIEVQTSLLDKYNKMSPEERAAEWKLLDKESKK